MGQRGPRAKPVALKILAGNPGKRPAQSVSGRGRLARGRPGRPSEVTGEAAAEWDRVAADLEAADMLAAVDRGVLTAYVLAVADMLAARAEILVSGRFIKTPVQTSTGKVVGESVKVHPAVSLLDRSSARVQRLAAELGLTPASRQRLEGDAIAEPRGNAVVAIRERIKQARSVE